MKVEVGSFVEVPDDAVEQIHRRVRALMQSVGTYRNSPDPRESSTPAEKMLVARVIAEYRLWERNEGVDVGPSR